MKNSLRFLKTSKMVITTTQIPAPLDTWTVSVPPFFASPLATILSLPLVPSLQKSLRAILTLAELSVQVEHIWAISDSRALATRLTRTALSNSLNSDSRNGRSHTSILNLDISICIFPGFVIILLFITVCFLFLLICRSTFSFLTLKNPFIFFVFSVFGKTVFVHILAKCINRALLP